MSSETDKTAAAFRATSIVLGLLPQIAGFVVGFCALAFVAGWFQTSAYYSEIGARWAVALLSPAQIMQSSAWMVTLAAGIAVPSIVNVIRGEWTRKGLFKSSQFFLILAAICYAVALWGDGHFSKPAVHIAAFLTSGCWAFAVGLIIGELVASLADNDARWHSYHASLIWLVLLYGLQQAPSVAGRSAAQSEIDSIASLPKVILKAQPPSADWHLLAAVGDKLLLLDIPKEGDTRRFDLVGTEEIDAIENRLATEK